MDAAGQFSFIDSHIHLWPGSERHTLRWNTEGGPLDDQYSLNEYLFAIGHFSAKLKCFIFVEADRKLAEREEEEEKEQWVHVLEEIDFYRRLKCNELREGEGEFRGASSDLRIAAVPWAPLPAGREVLASYLQLARQRAGAASDSIKGFRYLLQGKPAGTMLTDDFVDSLKLLGEQNYAFDLGVDFRGGGIQQLTEACSLMSRLNEVQPESQRTRVIINHMCKPDMQSLSSGNDGKLRVVKRLQWEMRIKELAAYPNTFMKLSGGFSETDALPPADAQSSMSQEQRLSMLDGVFKLVSYQIRFCLEVFGPARCMFGSNWPVENINGGGNRFAWCNWHHIMKTVCAELSEEDAKQVWSGTALRAYGLDQSIC